MSWKQLQELVAYDRESPIGAVREDWQAAAMTAGIVNGLLAIHRAESDNKKITHTFRVSDFLLKFAESEKDAPKEGRKEGKTWQEMRMIAQIVAAASNSRRK